MPQYLSSFLGENMKALKKKTSFYIDIEVLEKMAKLVATGKQSTFVCDLVKEKLEEIEKEKSRQKVLKMLAEIKPVKRKGLSARKTLEKLRKEREKELLKRIKN